MPTKYPTIRPFDKSTDKRPTVAALARTAGYSSHARWLEGVAYSAIRAAIAVGALNEAPRRRVGGAFGYALHAEVTYSGPDETDDGDNWIARAGARGVCAYDGSDDRRCRVTVYANGARVAQGCATLGESGARSVEVVRAPSEWCDAD